MRWRPGLPRIDSSWCSERRDCEVYGYLSLRLNSLAVLQVGFEAPLPHGFLSSRSKNAGAAQDAQVLNAAVRADQRLYDYRSLYLHLARQHRIGWVYRGLQGS